ncbi:MAG: DUF2971 domain-containing protein [Gammaproteobacteria bacterium]|nr:DUF2971 domain-containing protein [Gammaproteobacteria bacterium]
MKQTLYKYCSTSTETQLSRTLDTLSGRVYFPTPSKFNDPFELSAKVNISTSPLLDQLSTREKEEVQRIFRLRTPEAVSEEWRGKIGILCLTEDPLNILMWSHYAHNHTGICIGFDTESSPFNSAKQVTYNGERPQAEFNSDPESLINRGRRQKLSATPDLSGTVLPLCLIPNSALKSAPPFKSVVLTRQSNTPNHAA